MLKSELQIQFIDYLDNVVKKAEEILTSEQDLSPKDIVDIKKNIKDLYRIVCEIEAQEIDSPTQTVHRLKESVNELKKKIISAQSEISTPDLFSMVEPDTSLDRMKHTDQEEMTEPQDSDSLYPEPLSVLDNKEEVPLTEIPVPEEMTEPQDSDSLFPEPLSVLDNKEEVPLTEIPVPEEMTEPQDSDSLYPEPLSMLDNKEEVPLTETPVPEEMTEEPLNIEPDTDITEEGPEEVEETEDAEEIPLPDENTPDLSDFITKEDDVPTSYITQLSAMAQAHEKPVRDEDNHKAVASTAMPETTHTKRPSILDTLKQTEALHKSDPQNALRSLVDRYKTSMTVNDTRQCTSVSILSMIGINDKFLFINELFKGNINDYKELINHIDHCTEKEEVWTVLYPVMEKYQWDKESPAFTLFFDILKRKYQL